MGKKWGGVNGFAWHKEGKVYIVLVPEDPEVDNLDTPGTSKFTLYTCDTRKQAQRLCEILSDIYNIGIENGLIKGMQATWEIQEDLQDDLDEIDPSDILEEVEGETLRQKFYRAQSQSQE